MDGLILRNEVSIVFKNWSMVGWAIVSCSVRTIHSEMAIVMIVTVVAAKSMDVISDSSIVVDWCMGIVVHVMATEVVMKIVMRCSMSIVASEIVVNTMVHWSVDVVMSIMTSKIVVRRIMMSSVSSCKVMVYIMMKRGMGIMVGIVSSEVMMHIVVGCSVDIMVSVVSSKVMMNIVVNWSMHVVVGIVPSKVMMNIVVNWSMHIVVGIVSSKVMIGRSWEVDVVGIFLPSDSVVVVVVTSMVVVVAWVWSPVSFVMLSVVERHRVNTMVVREVVVDIMSSKVGIDGVATEMSVNSVWIVNWGVDGVVTVVAIQVECMSVVIPLSMCSFKIMIGVM